MSLDDNKQLVGHFLAEVSAAPPEGLRDVLERYCHPDVAFHVFHPVNTLSGVDALATGWFEPLRAAVPDHDHRVSFLISGRYEERDWVSALGAVQGSFESPLFGIPPTYGLAFLRFGLNAEVRDGRISRAYLLLDLVDLMRQAGFYPFRTMPGSPEQWPSPPRGSGADADTVDGGLGATTLRVIREMQAGLGEGETMEDHAANAEHSPHWHDHMNWYGPAGIGSTRGQRGFNDYHGALFIQAFPDRGGFERTDDPGTDDPGPYIQAADGHFGVTGGWPSLRGTHTGPGWLGFPASGREVTMRVADWYRTDDDDKIIDNWVMIDVLDIAAQLGYDVLEDTSYLVDPMRSRWPRDAA